MNERILIQEAASDSRKRRMEWSLYGVITLTVLSIFASSVYNTYTVTELAKERMANYRLCLNNQKDAMAAAVEKRGYLTVPSCGGL